MWKFRNPDDTAWNVLANKPVDPKELERAIEVPDDDPDVIAAAPVEKTPQPTIADVIAILQPDQKAALAQRVAK